MAESRVSFILTLRDTVSEGLKKVKSGLEGIEESAEKLRQTSMKMVEAGTKITLLGGVMAAAFALPVKEAADLEKEMSNVKAITGATEDQFLSLNAVAKELGRTTKYTAEETGAGMRFMAMAGFEVNDIISTMPNVLNLAAAANLDLAQAADITTNILKGYGLEVKDLAHANDVLVKTFTTTNTDLVQLGIAMKYVGPIARSAGVAFEETAASIGVLGNAGIQASMAGTTLRQTFIRLLDPPNEAKRVLEKLGITIIDESGKFVGMARLVDQLKTALAGLGGEAERTAVITQLFGARAAQGMAVLVQEGGAAIDSLANKLREAGGITDRIAKVQLENLSGAFTILRSAISGFLITVGEPFLKFLAKIFRGLANFVTWMSKVKESLGPLGNVLPVVIGFLGALLLVVGSVVTILGGLGLAVAGITIGLTHMSGLLSTVTTRLGAFAGAGTMATTSMRSFGMSIYTANTGLGKLAAGITAIGGLFAGWQLGTWISKLEIFGKTVTERVAAKIDQLRLVNEQATLSWYKLRRAFTFGDTTEIDRLIDKQEIYIKVLESSIDASAASRAAAEKRKESLASLVEEEEKTIQKMLESSNEGENYRKELEQRIKSLEKLKNELISYRMEQAAEKKGLAEARAYNQETIKLEEQLTKTIAEANSKLNSLGKDRAETVKKTYDEVLDSIEEGSEKWLELEKLRIQKLKAQSDLELAQEKRKYEEGVISLEQYLNDRVAMIEQNTEEVLALKRRELEELSQDPEANFEAIGKLEQEILALKVNSQKQQIEIEKELQEGLKKERQDGFNEWKNLQQLKLTSLKSDLDYQNQIEQLAQEKGELTQAQALENKSKRMGEYYEEQLRLSEETLTKIALMYGEDAPEYQSALEEKKRLQQEYELAIIQSERNITDSKKDEQKKALEFLKSLTGESVKLDEIEKNEKLEVLESYHKQGLLDTEQYEAARAAITKEASDEITDSLEEEAEAIENLSEAQAANFAEIAEGIMKYRNLSSVAKEFGGVASDLVSAFERFSGTLVLGSVEAEALEAAMSGNAITMIKTAEAMEQQSQATLYLSKDHVALARATELATAAQQLREEASIRMAIADREAASSLEALTIQTQEYLGVATSAQGATNAFASDIEKLDFALRNGLITQQEFNTSLEDLKMRLKEAVPEGTELYDTIMKALGGFEQGTLSIDDFVQALRDMTRPGKDAVDVLNDIYDELAGHSITTGAEEAKLSVEDFLDSMTKGMSKASAFADYLSRTSDSASNLKGQFRSLKDTIEELNKSDLDVGNIAESVGKGMNKGLTGLKTFAADVTTTIPAAGLGVTGKVLDAVGGSSIAGGGLGGVSEDIRRFILEGHFDVNSYDPEAANKFLNNVLGPGIVNFIKRMNIPGFENINLV